MPHWLTLIGIALAVSTLGFRKIIWFVSIGYAFSVVGLTIGMARLFGNDLTAATAPTRCAWGFS